MRRFAALVALALALTASVVQPRSPAEAAAADGCLPTNGLMNLNNADDLLAGTVRLNAGTTVQLGSGNINWAHTSLSPQRARDLYSLKWVEELVREHRRTNDARYLDRAVAIVLDFAADNPVGGGPDPDDAWYPMFAGQRTTAIACVAAVTNHGGVDTALRTHSQWLAGVVDGLDPWNQAIDPHLGLLMGGCDLGVAAWRNQARNGFVRLIRGMIDAEGALMEQAPGYGPFVWDRWGTVHDALIDCGLAPPTEIATRRAALLEWLAWMSAPDGTLSQIGDSPFGMYPPDPQGSPTAYTVPGGTTGSPPAGLVRVFDAGYVVGRTSWSNLADSTYWTLRFGPGRDHHGHEDHTAVTLWVDGREVLIDSGHDGYVDTAYREAMMAAEAHNVLVLPDIDFRVRRETKLLRSAAGAGWRFDEVRDEVYPKQENRQFDGPRTRGVLVLPDDGVMVVHDTATRRVEGPFDQLWHLVPGADVVATSRRGVVARHPSGDADIHVLQVPLPGQSLPRGSASVVEGQTDPFLGWASGPSGRQPAPVVRMRRTGTSTQIVTVVATTPVGGPLAAEARFVDGGWAIDLSAPGLDRTIGLSVDGAMRLGLPNPLPILTAGARRCFAVAGEPGDAAIVNMTPVLASGPGDGLLVSSDVTGSPVAANVNYGVGSIDPNVGVVPIGADGEVCFQNSVHASVHLVADHLGTIPAAFYEPAKKSGAPNRVIDTRSSGGVVGPGARRCFAVAGEPGDAAIVNMTPVLASGPGDGLLVSSDVTGSPVAANVNYGVGSIDPNVGVVPIGADGEVCFQNSVHASVHLVADHLGTIPAAFYEPAKKSGAPNRVIDTRSSGGVVGPGARRCFAVAGEPGDAAIVNMTPVLASGPGDGLLVSSDVTGSPVAANVNYGVGSIDPNVGVVPIGADGEVCFQNSVHASVHLVADHLGTIPAAFYEPAKKSGAPNRVIDTRE